MFVKLEEFSISYIDRERKKEEAFCSTEMHRFLREQVDYYIDFLDSFLYKEYFPCCLFKSLRLNDILSSVKKTLYDSYRCICSSSLSDAYMLLRKCRDDLFFFLYFISFFEQLEENYNPNNVFENKISSASFTTDINKLNFAEIDTLLSQADNGKDILLNLKACLAWINNDVSQLSNGDEAKEKLNCSNYLKVLKNDRQIKKIFSKGLSAYWYQLTDKLNNYTHTNGHQIILDNNLNLSDIKKAKIVIEKYVDDVEWIISAFASVYFLIKPEIVMSYDHIFCLEEGITPPPNSQYQVASMYVDFVNEHMSKFFPRVAEYVKSQNKVGMNYN